MNGAVPRTAAPQSANKAIYPSAQGRRLQENGIAACSRLLAPVSPPRARPGMARLTRAAFAGLGVLARAISLRPIRPRLRPRGELVCVLPAFCPVRVSHGQSLLTSDCLPPRPFPNR